MTSKIQQIKEVRELRRLLESEKTLSFWDSWKSEIVTINLKPNINFKLK